MRTIHGIVGILNNDNNSTARERFIFVFHWPEWFRLEFVLSSQLLTIVTDRISDEIYTALRNVLYLWWRMAYFFQIRLSHKALILKITRFRELFVLESHLFSQKEKKNANLISFGCPCDLIIAEKQLLGYEGWYRRTLEHMLYLDGNQLPLARGS